MKHLFSCQVFESHHIPASGPIILAINHRSYWDPLLIASAVSRPIQFLAKAPLFDIPLVGSILRGSGVIAVRRGQPDLTAVRRALNVLEHGGVLGIFPEGTCNSLRRLLPPWHGVGWLALASGAPVVPVAVHGYKVYKFNSPYHWPNRVSIRFAPPIHFPIEHYTNRNRLFRTLASHHVMDAIRSMIPTG